MAKKRKKKMKTIREIDKKFIKPSKEAIKKAKEQLKRLGFD